jgi:glycosyltransferase involved in cell wall biosynthesis
MVDVSVVIIALNEEENIARCIESIQRQTFPADRMELILADCSPVPPGKKYSPTAEIALGYIEKVYTTPKGFSVQKNYGARHGIGKYILNLDGDMTVSETLVQECFDICEKEDYAALYIPEVVVGEGMWIKARNFERSFYDHTCINGVRFIRRSVFDEIGGFDESVIIAEDWDFDRRINAAGRTMMVKSPLFHNEGRLQLESFMKGKAYYSRNLKPYIEKWGADDPMVRKQLGVVYRFFGVYTEHGKWKKLVCHPILATQMYLIKFMTGLQYLRHRAS